MKDKFMKNYNKKSERQEGLNKLVRSVLFSLKKKNKFVNLIVLMCFMNNVSRVG